MTDQTLELLLKRLDHLTAEFQELRQGVLKAVRISNDDPEMALTRARKVLEYVIRDVFKLRCQEDPGTRPLENLLQRLIKDGHLPKRLGAYASYIRELGNVGTHVYGEDLTKDDVRRSFENLTAILEWYFEQVRPDAFVKVEDLAGEDEEQSRRGVEEETRRKEQELAQELSREAEKARGLQEEEARRKDEELERKRQEAEASKLRLKVENASSERQALATEEVQRQPHLERVPANMANRVGMEFVWIPPGSFMMGSEVGNLRDKFMSDQKPIHPVTIREGFYMGKYAVTQKQWQQVRGDNPSHFKGENLPVEQVTWHKAGLFIDWLNKQNDGYTYRLPSETQWEYACRAGTTGEYAGDLDAMAWYSQNSGNKTHPVGSKLPNAFGLFDMHGNVWEWCQDLYRNSYSYAGAPTDESAWLERTGPDPPRFRVVRGGSYNYKANFCRSAYRLRYDPDWRVFTYVGLRIVAVART